jgi:hypothetical protein
MTEYRTRLRAYEFEPTIDWRALFVLSSLLSVGICAAMLILVRIGLVSF